MWNELYEWLGLEAQMRDHAANDPSSSGSYTLHLNAQVAAFRETRMRMRDLDESLPYEPSADG